jgi:predicted acetylornithine/succinylornithine family transaminase
MDELLAHLKELDSMCVMQTYNRLPVAFVRGEGTRLWDSDGREYLDLVAGLGVTVLGHSHPAVTEAVCSQAAMLLHTTNLYYIEPQAELAKLLSENCFEGRCFFANSGAEANEGALKLARKYHFMNGRPRSKVVGALGSFHGRTLATMSATGQPSRWEPFAPVVPGFAHVPLNDVEALGRAIDSETSAVIIEPILGEGGVHPATAEFLAAAREACDREGAVLIFDEVQSGMGRTGTFFAFEPSGVKPDVVTMAKGLANGVPAAAFIAAGKFAEVLAPGDHGTTFGGGFLACAAALATISTLLEQDIAGNAERVGLLLMKRLQELQRLPAVTGVRGRGLMLAVQLDRDSAREVVMGCLERGVLVNDVSPSAVRMLPALVLSEEEALQGASVLAEVLSRLKDK